MDNGLAEEKSIVNPAGPRERLLQKREEAMSSIARSRKIELEDYYLKKEIHKERKCRGSYLNALNIFSKSFFKSDKFYELTADERKALAQICYTRSIRYVLGGFAGAIAGYFGIDFLTEYSRLWHFGWAPYLISVLWWILYIDEDGWHLDYRFRFPLIYRKIKKLDEKEEKNKPRVG